MSHTGTVRYQMIVTGGVGTPEPKADYYWEPNSPFVYEEQTLELSEAAVEEKFWITEDTIDIDSISSTYPAIFVSGSFAPGFNFGFD